MAGNYNNGAGYPLHDQSTVSFSVVVYIRTTLTLQPGVSLETT